MVASLVHSAHIHLLVIAVCRIQQLSVILAGHRIT